jgi:phosphoglycerate dehydrogenase-like enzyme
MTTVNSRRRGAPQHRPPETGVHEQPLILLGEHLSEPATRWLAQRSRLVAVAHDAPAFADVLAEADGLLVRTYTRVDESLLRRAPRLRVVGRAGVGLDNVDVPACRARGIEVVYTPQANTQAVVEYVFCLIGDALRPRRTVDQALEVRKWERIRQETFGRREISQCTLGILGLGRIGRRVAQVARAIGGRVLYNDLISMPREVRFGADPVAVEDLFETADILSIHIDGRATNRRFIGSHLVQRMKGDVVFLNTSRGFVVDNVALAAFLRAHPEAEAHLDVHEPEPFDESYPLLGLRNAKLYPHLAARTEQAMLNMSWVVKDVMAVLEGRTPQWPAPEEL